MFLIEIVNEENTLKSNVREAIFKHIKEGLINGLHFTLENNEEYQNIYQITRIQEELIIIKRYEVLLRLVDWELILNNFVINEKFLSSIFELYHS